MASNSDILPVKVRFGEQIRRVDIKKSLKFCDLIAVLSGLFGRSFKLIKYKDEDGDLVTLSSEEEFEEAINKVVPKTGGVLKLVLQLKDEVSKNEPDVNSVEKSCARDGGDARKRNADNKDEDMPRKKKHGTNKVDYYTSLSAALKDMSSEKEDPGAAGEPLRVYLPPIEVDANNYQPNYEVLTNLQRLPSNSDSVKAPQMNEQEADIEKTGNPVGLVSSTTKPKMSPAKKKRRRRRRSRSSSSSSSSGSSSSGSSGSSSSSNSSSSSSSSSSDSDSSESSHSSFEDVAMEKGLTEKEKKKRLNQRKRRQRKRHEVKMIARQLTHYVAPEVCDEVAHCMHHYKKDLKHSMARKIVGTIESTITHAFKKYVVTKTFASIESEEEPGKQEAEVQLEQPTRERFNHVDITCDGCDEDICGPRYKCGNCPDYDLCENCEAIEGIHDKTHVFLKMNFPAVNAGRKNGTGRMRPLLKENIYLKIQDEKKEESNDKNSVSEQHEFNVAMENQPALDLRNVENSVSKELKEGEVAATKIIPVRSVSSVSVQKSPSNEEICTALEGLKIVQSSQQVATDDNGATKDKAESTETKVTEEESEMQAQSAVAVNEGHVSDDDDVVVVRHEHATESIPQVKTLDLLDTDVASISSNGSEDFVVVPIPKYFDINSPLDEETIMEHWRHCRGSHTADCCPAAKILNEQRNGEKSANMPMDLVASSLPKSRPDIAQVQNLMDTDLEEISAQTQIIEAQPTVDASAMPPLIPITIQPTATSVKAKGAEIEQPEPPVMYGRGAAPASSGLAQEPRHLVMRDGRALCERKNEEEWISYPDVASKNNVDLLQSRDIVPAAVVRDEDAVKDSAVAKVLAVVTDSAVSKDSGVVEDGAVAQAAISKIDNVNDAVRTGPIGFNQPAEKFLQQQREHKDRVKMESSYRAETWAPERTTTGGDGSVTQAIAGYLTEIVDATASAVTAVGETMSNAMNVNNDLPTVKYQEESVQIMRNGDKADKAPVTKMADLRDPSPARSASDMLQDMGFFDEAKNRRLLDKYKGDVNQCVGELLGDNNWHNNRH